MFDDLLNILQRVDRYLENALVQAQLIYGSDTSTDPYRGLYLNQNDVKNLLNRPVGIPLFSSEIELPPINSDCRLTWLQNTFSLSEFELDIILIALAPEVDLKYERLYAYLQDDVSRKRPTLDLALNLLCQTPEVKIARRCYFAPNAPLIQNNLLQLIPDSRQLNPPLLSYYLKLDPQIIRFLLAQGGLDRRLASFCRLLTLANFEANLSVSPSIEQTFLSLVELVNNAHQSLQFYFSGSQKSLKLNTAQAIAHHINLPLLVADLHCALTEKIDWQTTFKLLFRESRLQNSLLYLDGVDALRTKEQENTARYLFKQLVEYHCVVILSGVKPWFPDEHQPLAMINIEFPLPDFTQRRQHWQQNIAAVGVELQDRELDILAERFRLTTNQITDAVGNAYNQALWDLAARSPETLIQGKSISLTSDYLLAAARRQSGHQLTSLAKKIESKYTWDDIVLLPDQLEQLQDICNQAKYQHLVYEQWGFASKLSLGKGLNVLFSGLPGTGKTMAAEAIANDLQLDLYKIDLSQVVSKYIGETEKNLEQVFTAAENTNAILLFDEADAIFGKRSEVKDAHDRYANLEVAYLLQKMEEYPGITILTTNLRQNLDDAFTRRIRFIVEFPFPEAASRLQIWQGIFPPQIPLAETVDLSLLASKFKLAGGNIRNIALAAAFLAAQKQESVGMPHLFQATKREFQKMGRLVSDEEFGYQEK